MAKYKMTINTDAYVCGRCSTKNWEAGTRNDYMLSINGINRTLKTKRELLWQLELFCGRTFLQSEYSEENGLSGRYLEFLRKNMVTFYDRLCKISRSRYLSAYGFAQGYVDCEKIISDLHKVGDKVTVQFKQFYDVRQYDKDMNGCYLMIEKIA